MNQEKKVSLFLSFSMRKEKKLNKKLPRQLLILFQQNSPKQTHALWKQKPKIWKIMPLKKIHMCELYTFGYTNVTNMLATATKNINQLFISLNNFNFNLFIFQIYQESNLSK